MSAKIKTKASAGKAKLKKINLLSPRNLLFLFAALVFTVSTLLAFTQEPFPTPFKAKTFLSQHWWQYPIERNAFTRLPFISSPLNDIFILPDGKNIWIVGERGFILHSNNAGKSWQQQKIESKVSSNASLIFQPLPDKNTSEKFNWNIVKQANAANKAPATQTLSQQKKKSPNTKSKTNHSKKEKIFTKPSADLSAVYFINSQKGWAVGRYGTIIHTSNGGNTWQNQFAPTGNIFLSVQFLKDGLNGWATGAGGVIVHTRDGGNSWTHQNSRTRNDLTSIHFLDDGQRGWVVGDKGSILSTLDGGSSWKVNSNKFSNRFRRVQFLDEGLHGWIVGGSTSVLYTQDGGSTWQKRSSRSPNYLSDVMFLDDAQHGWVVDGIGTILQTIDGGNSWQAQNSRSTFPLRRIWFLNDAKHGWIVGNDGVILQTLDGGISWSHQSSGSLNRLSSIQFLDDGLHGWIISDKGTLLSTLDGGSSWQVASSNIAEWLSSVQFFSDNMRGWVIGNDGAIFHTLDGGENWQRQNSGSSSYLVDIYMLDDGQRGWTVGVFGTLLRTLDAGNTWQKQNSGTTSRLNSIQFLNDGQRGWAVGYKGTILRTLDGGDTWLAQKSNTSTALNNVHFLNNGLQGWIAGDDGSIIHSTNGGETWLLQNSTTSESIESVQFLEDGQTGWALAEYNIILYTTNAGRSWQPIKSQALHQQRDMQFHRDGLQGWIAGTNSTILRTLDGGKTWQSPLAAYQRYPAPWYYLSWLVIVGLLAPTLRREKAEFDETESVADLLISDRPLEKGDPDPLGFNAIALGLSRFIRNENTLPPLTLAITGVWGSGKSSLMNLLKADLKSYGFRPVWFNAWHYQKEEHLLAALLSNIRDQAIPPWWCYAGLVFRGRLMLMRGWRQCFPLLIVLGVFVASTSFLYQQPGNFEQRINNLSQTLERFFTFSKTAEKPPLLENKSANPAPQKSNDTSSETLTQTNQNADSNLMIKSSFLISLLALISGIIKGFTAFGISPTRLMSTMSSRSNAKDLNKQLSFRHQFAREFKDVTRALGERTMVIMVDDLDRCRPESVLEVLESINFLVSSGDCYIILGMDPKRVVSCVAMGFKDLSEQDLQPEQKHNSTEAYAISYLEKLINIEVPVPAPQASQSKKLLGTESTALQEPSFIGGLASSIWGIRHIAFVILVIGISWQLGMKLGAKPETIKPAINPIEQSTANDKQAAATTTPENKNINEGENPPKQKKLASFKAGQTADVSGYFSLPPLFLMLLVAAWIFWLRQPKVVVTDSPEFIKALGIWHKLVISEQQTPRSIKRFMNRVRYFAMHHQVPAAQNKLFLNWLGKNKKKPAPLIFEQHIPEEMLVAMAAMHHTNPDWLDNDALFIQNSGSVAMPHSGKTETTDNNNFSNAIFYESVLEHLEYFKQWPPTAEQRELFRKISAGIYVH